MSFVKWILYSVAALAAPIFVRLYAIFHRIKKKATHKSIFPNDTLLASHRGLRDYPENTIASVKAAIDEGFKIVEVDVKFTKDGYAVLSHDPSIDRVSNGHGLICMMTYNDLLKYDFSGEQLNQTSITSLMDILQFIKGKDVILNIDCAHKEFCKSSHMQTVAECIYQTNTENQVYVEIKPSMLLYAIRYGRDITFEVTCCNINPIAKFAIIKQFSNYLAGVVILTHSMEKRIIKQAHAHGCKISYWTAKNINEVRYYMNENYDIIGVDDVLPKEIS